MQVRWEEDAISDLLEVRDYIAKENPAAAQKTAEKIVEATSILAEHPLIGKAGRLHATREYVIKGTPYTLVYLAESECMTLLRIFHQSRSWNSFINKSVD